MYISMCSMGEVWDGLVDKCSITGEVESSDVLICYLLTISSCVLPYQTS